MTMYCTMDPNLPTGALDGPFPYFHLAITSPYGPIFHPLKVLRFMYDAPFYTLLQNTQDRLGEARKGTEAFAIWLGHFSGDLFYLVWIGSETGSSGAWLSVD